LKLAVRARDSAISIAAIARGLEGVPDRASGGFLRGHREREDAGIIVLHRRSVEEEPGGAHVEHEAGKANIQRRGIDKVYSRLESNVAKSEVLRKV